MSLRKVLLLAILVIVASTMFSATGLAQTGPHLVHPGSVSWYQGLGFVWLVAETQTIQYRKADLFVAHDVAFGPVQLGTIGTLFINPGAVVYLRLGMNLTPFTNAPWETFVNFRYPTLHRALIGARFKVQVLAHDTTNPGRYVLSQNAQAVTITL